MNQVCMSIKVRLLSKPVVLIWEVQWQTVSLCSHDQPPSKTLETGTLHTRSSRPLMSRNVDDCVLGVHTNVHLLSNTILRSILWAPKWSGLHRIFIKPL